MMIERRDAASTNKRLKTFLIFLALRIIPQPPNFLPEGSNIAANGIRISQFHAISEFNYLHLPALTLVCSI